MSLIGGDALPSRCRDDVPMKRNARAGHKTETPTMVDPSPGPQEGDGWNQLAMNCTAGTYHGAVLYGEYAPQHAGVLGESKRKVLLPAAPLSQ